MGENEIEVIGGEMSPQAEIINSGAALIRLENTTQIQMAVQKPRDEKKILEAALAELETYPSMAEEAIYVKPVGKKEGVMQYAEGLSIRTAESLANRWGNSAFGVEIAPDPDEDGVILIAVFLDYENNTRHVITKKVSRTYKTYDNKIKQHAPDRFADIVVPANQSKLLREIILRSLPAGLKKEYELKARKILAGGKIPERIEKMIDRFAEFGVTKEMISKYKEKEIEDFSSADLTEMIGIYNSMKDGETTVGQVFGAAEKTTETEQPSLVPTNS